MAGGATAEPGRTATLHGRASTSSARSTDRLPRVLSTTPRRPCRGSSHVSDASPPATACLRHAPPPCRRDAPAVGARHAGGRPQRGAHLDLTLCQAPGFWRREREPAASVAYRASPRCGTRHASTTWGAGRNPSAASPRGAASWPPRPERAACAGRRVAVAVHARPRAGPLVCHGRLASPTAQALEEDAYPTSETINRPGREGRGGAYVAVGTAPNVPGRRLRAVCTPRRSPVGTKIDRDSTPSNYSAQQLIGWDCNLDR